MMHEVRPLAYTVINAERKYRKGMDELLNLPSEQQDTRSQEVETALKMDLLNGLADCKTLNERQQEVVLDLLCLDLPELEEVDEDGLPVDFDIAREHITRKSLGFSGSGMRTWALIEHLRDLICPAADEGEYVPSAEEIIRDDEGP